MKDLSKSLYKGCLRAASVVFIVAVVMFCAWYVLVTVAGVYPIGGYLAYGVSKLGLEVGLVMAFGMFVVFSGVILFIRGRRKY